MKQDTKIASFISVAPQPTFVPSQPSTLPNLSGAGVTATISSPSKGSCDAKISYVLNGSQIGVMIEGTDTLPSVACATFTDAVASGGFKAKLSNVPYPNSSTKATVEVELSP